MSTNDNEDCYSLFFNLIVSQLFIGSISFLIEFIRLIVINVMQKYLLSTNIMRRYMPYIQSFTGFILLLSLGILLFYTMQNINHHLYGIINSILIFLLSCLLIFVFLYIYNKFKTKNQLNQDYKNL